MSESTESTKFVVLEYNAPTNWAGEDDEDEQGKNFQDQRPVKPAWGNVNTVAATDNTPDLKSIFAEEKTKREKEKERAPPLKQPYRPPKPTSTNRDEYDSQSSYDNYRSPREKLPVPDVPPFTAFVGNLSFEVTEEKLREYFLDLSPVSIRIMKEDDKPKGYAYIEFPNKDGLVKALCANGEMFYGRTLNMDVAKPSKGRSDRYDTNWTGSGKVYSTNRPTERTSYQPQSFNRPSDRPTERPRLNINPPAPRPPSAQATQLHENLNKPKGSFENPFGTAPLDKEKQDEAAKRRLIMDIEREKKRERKKRRIGEKSGY